MRCLYCGRQSVLRDRGARPALWRAPAARVGVTGTAVHRVRATETEYRCCASATQGAATTRVSAHFYGATSENARRSATAETFPGSQVPSGTRPSASRTCSLSAATSGRIGRGGCACVSPSRFAAAYTTRRLPCCLKRAQSGWRVASILRTSASSFASAARVKARQGRAGAAALRARYTKRRRPPGWRLARSSLRCSRSRSPAAPGA